jgi:hypothetical protein
LDTPGLGDFIMGMNNRMKHVNLKSLSCVAFVLCATLLLYFPIQISAQENGTSLMLETSPAEGGYLNIKPGVHTFDMYAEVALKATPKPGYQFVCWLGSVNESSASSTSIMLDSPKMVIAVFERTQFEMTGNDDVGGGGSDSVTSSSSDNGGFLVRSAGESDTSLEQAVTGSTQEQPSGPHIPHNVPVPGPEVPEPATMTLLFTGFLMLVNRRRKGEI